MPIPRCLIVDDERSIRGYLKAILMRTEFEVHEAESAQQALSILEELSGEVSVVFSDVRMPGDMDGLALAQAVRNKFPSIRVILMSGYAEDEDALQSFEFMRKPFVPAVVLSTLSGSPQNREQ